MSRMLIGDGIARRPTGDEIADVIIIGHTTTRKYWRHNALHQGNGDRGLIYFWLELPSSAPIHLRRLEIYDQSLRPLPCPPSLRSSLYSFPSSWLARIKMAVTTLSHDLRAVLQQPPVLSVQRRKNSRVRPHNSLGEMTLSRKARRLRQHF